MKALKYSRFAWYEGESTSKPGTSRPFCKMVRVTETGATETFRANLYPTREGLYKLLVFPDTSSRHSLLQKIEADTEDEAIGSANVILSVKEFLPSS